MYVQGLIKLWQAAWFRKITVIIHRTVGMILKTHNYDLDNWSLRKIQLVSLVVMKGENNENWKQNYSDIRFLNNWMIVVHFFFNTLCTNTLTESLFLVFSLAICTLVDKGGMIVHSLAVSKHQFCHSDTSEHDRKDRLCVCLCACVGRPHRRQQSSLGLIT